jgi:fatty acid desaturase
MKDTSKQIVPPEVLKQLAKRSNFKGLLQLFLHLFCILITGTAIVLSQHSIWLIPALIVHGMVLIFVFAPLHETIHFTAFKSRWLNNAVAAVFGFILFLPYQYFRTYHYVHHRHTQDPERDPELIDKKPYTKTSYLFYLSGIPVWRWHLTMLWQHAQGKVEEPYIEAREHSKIITEARVHLALYLMLLLVSLFTASTGLFWFWILPVFIGQPFLRLYLMAEHSDCDLTENMLENSRTIYASPVINFLAWNMPYHAEHHYLASVPFHALPALHAYTGQAVKHLGDGYWRVLRNVSNKIMGAK